MTTRTDAPLRYRWLARRLERTDGGRKVVAYVRQHEKGFAFLETLAMALVIALVARTYVVQSFRIPSESMHPTLEIGDQLLVWKFWYRFHEPEAGDIVVFEPPAAVYSSETPHYIKRVVAEPGDRLDLVRQPGSLPGFGHVHLNGEPVESAPFIPHHAYAMFVPGSGPNGLVPFSGAQVPEGEVYVFGDNTLASSDSRIWGGVPVENLEGKAFFRFWPPARFGPLE